MGCHFWTLCDSRIKNSRGAATDHIADFTVLFKHHGMFPPAVTPVCKGHLIHLSHSNSTGGRDQALEKPVNFRLENIQLVFIVFLFFPKTCFFDVDGV